MLCAHAAAACTIGPVKAHTYELALNALLQNCVCLFRSLFPPVQARGDFCHPYSLFSQLSFGAHIGVKKSLFAFPTKH